MSAPGAEFNSCRIRAKRLGPGDKCLFCLLVNDGLNPEVVLAMVYVMAHMDAASSTGPCLCDDCLHALHTAAGVIATHCGGGIHHMSAPGIGKA